MKAGYVPNPYEYDKETYLKITLKRLQITPDFSWYLLLFFPRLGYPKAYGKLSLSHLVITYECNK